MSSEPVSINKEQYLAKLVAAATWPFVGMSKAEAFDDIEAATNEALALGMKVLRAVYGQQNASFSVEECNCEHCHLLHVSMRLDSLPTDDD